LAKARKAGVETPYLLFVDMEKRKIYMQFVGNAVTMKEFL